MNSLDKISTTKKIWSLLTPAGRHSAVVILCLVFIGTLLETLGVGLVIPALALLTQNDVGLNYPMLQSILQMLGNPNQKTLVIGSMLLLVFVYTLKVIFLAMLAF